MKEAERRNGSGTSQDVLIRNRVVRRIFWSKREEIVGG
jgi:hypothetical protein